MNLSDAKKILSGGLVPDSFATLWVNSKQTSRRIGFNHEELKYMLRQLALKVVRENEK